MKLIRTPIAAALCCMALAAAPYALAAGDTHGSSMNRTGATGSMHGASSMDSSTVRQVQQALADKGHNPGPIDGVMGAQTRAALQSYQRQQNLSGARGMDQQTLNSLGVQASASGSAGSMAGASGSASGSNASTGSSSMAGPTSNPSPSGSNASTGTASDGGPNSRNPSGGPTARKGDSGSSAGGTGSTTGGSGGSR